MASCKRLLLVSFVFLCFISITARARSLRAASSTHTNEAGPKGHVDDLFTRNEDGMEASSDELVSMDYTPTKKKPPIHN